MSRTRAALTALVLLSALALGGCSGDDPQPKFSPPASTSPAAPSTSADQSTFVRAYFESIGRAAQTGQSSLFMTSTSDQCANCRTIAQNIDKAFADGGRIEGASWTVQDARTAGEQGAGTVWNVDVATAQERWYDGAGALLKTVRPSMQHFAVIVAPRDDTLEVLDLRLLP